VMKIEGGRIGDHQMGLNTLGSAQQFQQPHAVACA